MIEFRKAHMRTFCYSIRDMNYRQMRAYVLYGIQLISILKNHIGVISISKINNRKDMCKRFSTMT